MTITRTGDIWTIGPHRLACGDSGDQTTIAALMQNRRADLVFTSPPYSGMRTYIAFEESDWDRMMRAVFDALPVHDATQVIVNLGLIHCRNEIVWYWTNWLAHMKQTGWRNIGLYVWDKKSGMCGHHHGRLAPSHEFLFHFNRKTRSPNKTKVKVSRLLRSSISTVRDRHGSMRVFDSPHTSAQPNKIPDSVIRLSRETQNRRTAHGSHPAVFPVSLPTEMIEAYTSELERVFDPFAGSATTLISAHRTNRIGYGCEIEPSYVDLAVDRLQRETGLIARREDGLSFDHLSDPDFFSASSILNNGRTTQPS